MTSTFRSWRLFTVLAFGYAFLYGPIFLLVIYSFNESKLVTVWSGFSVKWYGELIHNEKLLEAAWLSLKIAFVSDVPPSSAPWPPWCSTASGGFAAARCSAA